MSVDVEYHRWRPHEIDGLKKQLNYGHAAGGTRDWAQHDVYPGIIVHRRPGSTAEDNLLAAEVKKEESAGHDRDRAKLRAFMEDPFSYQLGVFLILLRDGSMPKLEWFAVGIIPPARVEPHPQSALGLRMNPAGNRPGPVSGDGQDDALPTRRPSRFGARGG